MRAHVCAFKRWGRAVCVGISQAEKGSGTGGLEREPELWKGILTHTLIHTHTHTHTHTQTGESKTVQTHQSILTLRPPERHVRRVGVKESQKGREEEEREERLT